MILGEERKTDNMYTKITHYFFKLFLNIMYMLSEIKNNVNCVSTRGNQIPIQRFRFFVFSAIILTCPCNAEPITTHFYIVKLGFTVVQFFLNFALKHRL